MAPRRDRPSRRIDSNVIESEKERERRGKRGMLTLIKIRSCCSSEDHFVISGLLSLEMSSRAVQLWCFLSERGTVIEGRGESERLAYRTAQAADFH